ncbi:hypothetical protein GCM10023114_18660 [Mycolicibacterium sediminis]
MVDRMAPFVVFIAVTVLSPLLVTYNTSPAALTARAVGALPTGIVASAAPEAPSIAVMELPAVLAV